MTEIAEKPATRGTVLRCPSCGAPSAAFASSCGACGHEFSDVAANRTIASLVARFEEIERDPELKTLRSAARTQALLDRKARAIRDFPVPHSREDLQQLLHFIQPRLLPSVKPDPNIEDWRAKFAEVVGRARFAYKDDAATLASFHRMERALSMSVGAGIGLQVRRHPMLALFAAGVVVVALALAVQQQRASAALQACEASYASSAGSERGRLDALVRMAGAALAAGRLAEASSQADAMRWGLADGACKVTDNQAAASAWTGRREGLLRQVKEAEATQARQAQAVAEQARAAAQAETERQAEQERQLAEQQRVAQEAARMKAASEAITARQASFEKTW